ncbi:MAG TPA: hypothetical protein PLG66_05710, partial [Calditrichia bacterium]|nr:hypothetical protein [Calditrichia bacterium]
QPIFASLVNTELEVEIVPFDSISYNFAQGATNVALFMLRFTNLSNSDSIIVNGLTLSAREAEGLNNTVPDITNLISRFRAVSKAFYEAGLSKIQTPDELGNLPLSADTNPVAFNYSNLDRLGPGEVSEVVLLMDLANLQINRSFKVRVDDVAAIDGQGRNVDVIDPNGAEFRSQGAQFQSPLAITILSREGKDSFFNYPNPFGMDTQILNPPTERGNTRFVFVPKSEPASGELRIYTLTGGLVTRIEKSLDGFQADQAYSRPFVWNGLNDDGERVVNGVYVAVLRITYRDGSTDRFETKVAYIK